MQRGDTGEKVKISIHTSAKEVTYRMGDECPVFPISIHTSAKEVTINKPYFQLVIEDFNPHFREGSDQIPHPQGKGEKISIHTSAKEVTERLYIGRTADQFQSTLPRRKWPETYMFYISGQYFNPHFREGSDVFQFYSQAAAGLFQSTLPRRKWPYRNYPMYYLSIFQSTLPRRKWPYYLRKCTGHDWFQSTLPRRKWRRNINQPRQIWNFNPHFREGSDRCWCAN